MGAMTTPNANRVLYGTLTLAALSAKPVATPASELKAVRVAACAKVIPYVLAISGKTSGTKTSIMLTAKTALNIPNSSNFLGEEKLGVLNSIISFSKFSVI